MSNTPNVAVPSAAAVAAPTPALPPTTTPAVAAPSLNREEAAYDLFTDYVFRIDLIKSVFALPQMATTAWIEIVSAVLKMRARGKVNLMARGRAALVAKLQATPIGASVGGVFDAAAPRDVRIRELMDVVGAESQYEDAESIVAIAQEKVLRELGVDDAIFIFALEKFAVQRPDGTYDIDKMVGQDSTVRHLVKVCGYDVDTAWSIVKKVLHRSAFSIDIDPEKPAMFTNELGQETVNIYVQPTVEPMPGAWWGIFWLLYVLTGAAQDDLAGARWLFNWMAALVQKPGRRGMVSPCFIGKQGSGKTALGMLLARIVGLANCAQISGKALKDNFNSQFAPKLFVVANEVILPGEDRLEVVETMKVYLTDEVIDLMIPHARRVQIQNRLSLWLTSNSTNPIRVEGNDDRRWAVFSVTKDDLTPEYMKHVKGLFDQITMQPTAQTSREIEALAHDLLCWEVDWNLATTPLKNAARQQQIEMSKGSFDQFADLIDDDGGLSELAALVHSCVYGRDDATARDLIPYSFEGEGTSVDVIFAAYQRFCLRIGSKPLAHARFCGEWSQRFGQRWQKGKRTTAPRKPIFLGLVLPDRQLMPQLVADSLGQASEAQLRAELQRRARPVVDNPAVGEPIAAAPASPAPPTDGPNMHPN